MVVAMLAGSFEVESFATADGADSKERLAFTMAPLGSSWNLGEASESRLRSINQKLKASGMNQSLTLSSRYNFTASHAVLRRYVEEDVVPGVSTAVLVGDDLVDLHCVGWADKEAQSLVRPDHIFRVFSNTSWSHRVRSCFSLSRASFSSTIPSNASCLSWGSAWCSRPRARDVSDTEPAIGPITVRHLMTHSSGLSYGMFDPETPIFKAYAERGVNSKKTSLAQMVDALEDLPLVFHPGTSWEYSVASDVLARLVEVISGSGFDEYIQASIFAPLGMVDTGFVVPQHNHHRLVAYYAGVDYMTPLVPGLTRTDAAPYPDAYLRPVARSSGGGGLVSTLPDMISLIRSLSPIAPTLLKPGTIKMMMSNQLPDDVWLRFPRTGVQTGKGFGLSGSVLVRAIPLRIQQPRRTTSVGRTRRNALVDRSGRGCGADDDATPNGFLAPLLLRVQAARV